MFGEEGFLKRDQLCVLSYTNKLKQKRKEIEAKQLSFVVKWLVNKAEPRHRSVCKVPGFYFLAQNRENLDRLRKELRTAVPSPQKTQRSRQGRCQCFFST